jgi:hypothetical protein
MKHANRLNDLDGTNAVKNRLSDQLVCDTQEIFIKLRPEEFRGYGEYGGEKG